MAQDKINLNSPLSDLFSGSTSVSGEEELLRIASKYSLQLTNEQIRVLEFFHILSHYVSPTTKEMIDLFISRYIDYKQYNQSNRFIMTALDSISLRKFIGQNSFNVKMDR